jgi:hypothetical protein
VAANVVGLDRSERPGEHRGRERGEVVPIGVDRVRRAVLSPGLSPASTFAWATHRCIVWSSAARRWRDQADRDTRDKAKALKTSREAPIAADKAAKTG